LTSHGDKPNEYATLYSKIQCHELYDTLSKQVSTICKFRNDEYIEKEEEFWQENYYILYKAFLKAVDSLNIKQFNEYVRIIQEPYFILRKARQYRVVRNSNERNFNNIRYLFLYTDTLEWLLKKKDNINVGIFEDFIHSLEHSIWEQIKDEIKKGDCYTSYTFGWLIPSAYQLFIKHVTDRNTRQWELRAFCGSSFSYLENIFDECESKSKEEKTKVKLVLHRGIIKWLLISLENEDNELSEALCESARKLVFGDKGITLDDEELTTQHLILCGKMLVDIINNATTSINSKHFNLLLHDKYSSHRDEHPQYDALVDYYSRYRKNRSLREFLREFDKTRWERNPLTRGGFSSAIHTFSGDTEFDYIFLYLAFLTMQHNPGEMKPVPTDFSFYRLEEKIETLKDVAGDIKLYTFNEGTKGKFVQWLNDSNQLYEQQEQQKIIAAPLENKSISEFKNSFWEGYKNTKSFLDICLKLECFKIDENINAKGGGNRHKEIFIKELNSLKRIAESDGSGVSRAYSEGLLEDVICKKDPDESVGDYTTQLDRACSWLIKYGLNKEKSLLLYYGNVILEGKLYKNDDYVPHWKVSEDVIYHGYYKGYPLMTVYKKEIEPICVALKLEEWKGVKIRPEILEGRFGTVTVRERTDTELDGFIRKGEIEKQERNEVRTRCPVEFELYWELDKEDLPVQFTVGLKKTNSTESSAAGKAKRGQETKGADIIN